MTQTFGKYFSQYYAKTKEQWAACYRKAAFVNTNMYVEAFHHVLKYIYMKGKVNKRVDKCIHVLKFARDKAFERLVKLEKGKVTARIHVIMARHLASQKSPTHLVTEQSDTSWIVTSHDGQRDYYVTWETDGCQLQCLKCTECDICVHSYSCNCPDHLIHNTICKHIHLVARFQREKPAALLSDYEPELDTDPHSPPTTAEVGSECILHEIQSTDSETDIITLKEKLQEKLSILCAHVHQCNSRPALISAKSHVTSAINIIKALSQNTNETKLQCKTTEPSNKNITPKRQFFSTKKKCQRPIVRLSKPSTEEKDKISSSLLKSGPLIRMYGGHKGTIPKRIASKLD